MLVSAYLNGSTLGTPPPPQDHERAPRGIVNGWSTSAVRRHTKWLYSIDSAALSGDGFAVTLTLRDCPADAGEWHTLLDRFIKRLRRAGLIRYHWVTEWQERGVPHLHGALYWPEGAVGFVEAFRLILDSWLDVSALHGAQGGAQDIKRIDGPVGWLKYLSKHAARGVKHYQRQGKPEGWEKTGRLWGYGGEWPATDPMQFDLSRHAGFRYRRLIRAWTIADARRHSDGRRERWAKHMLRCSDPKLSPVRGVSGWVPESVSLGLIALLWDQGEGVIQRVETDSETEHGSQGGPELAVSSLRV